MNISFKSKSLMGIAAAWLLAALVPTTGLAQSNSTPYGYHCIHTEARDRDLPSRQSASSPSEETRTPLADTQDRRAAASSQAPVEDAPNVADDEALPAPTAEDASSSKTDTEKKTRDDGVSSAAPDQATTRQARRQRRKALRRRELPTGRNALGLSVGLASGIGLSYRHYVTNFLALRLDGGVIANTQGALYSVGFSVQEDFLRTYFHRLYALQAFAVHGKPGRVLLVPGAGAGYEYNFGGMRRGVSLRGELVLSPVFATGEAGPRIFTFLPQFGISFVY